MIKCPILVTNLNQYKSMNKIDSKKNVCSPITQKKLKNTRAFYLIFILLVIQSFTSAFAQQGTVSLNKKQISVKQALKEIEAQSQYTLFYNDADIDSGKKIDVKIEDKDINTALSQILPGFTFKLNNNKIILIPQGKTEEDIISKSPQQSKTVAGTISDASGDPLIGVSVKLKGSSTIGTVTDIDGHYSLNVPNKGELIVSYIGYKEVTVPVAGKTTLNISLAENTELLDEVVVVGYGIQKKANLSGAVEGISKKVLEDRPLVNIGQGLQGAVGNLNITMPSGQANSTPKFNIRGATALESANERSPLIVIDGIVSSIQELNNMNSADIENISVLKDAASAAIYGSRAAFGVILVTTKNGESEKVKVNYNNNFTFNRLINRPDVVTDPATVVDMRNVFSYPWYNLYDENAIAYAKKRSADPSISPYFVNNNGEWEYFGNTNWYDEAYKDAGFATNHGIDISGATKLVSYFFSGNYFLQNGMLKQDNDKFNRYNLRSKLNFHVNDRWTVGNNTSYSTADYDAPSYLGSDYYWNISRKNTLDIPTNPDGTWTSTGADLLGRMRDGGRRNTLNSIFTTQFSTKYELVKDVWTVNGSFALNRSEYSEQYAYLPIAYREGPDMQMKYHNITSSAGERSDHTDNLVFDVYTNFNKTFNKKHFVNVVGGFNQEEYKYRRFNGEVKDLISDNLPSINLGTGDQRVSASSSEYALRGLFYRVNYIFDNKYIIETNGRYDGTSRFPKDDRFAFNPSVSAAWVASQESFMSFISPAVSSLKFRASYGSLGNQDVSNYPYIPIMSKGQTTLLLDGKQPVYIKVPGLVSSSLTWETVQTLNFGVDVNFLNNRLTTVFDIYRRDVKDMLAAGKKLPNVLGVATQPLENAVDMRTNGWELTIKWKDQFHVKGKPFVYNMNFVLADNETTVTKFDNPTGSLDKFYVGQKLGEIWGMKTLGYFQSEEEIKNHADQTTVSAYPGTHSIEPGDLKFWDKNGDEKVDWGDWTLSNPGDYYRIGNTTPRYNFSFLGAADWNNIDFSFFLQGIGKRDYYPGGSDLLFWGVYSQPWTNVSKQNLDYWTPENTNAYFPRRKSYVAEGGRELAAPQTKYLQSAAYVRLKNITIGYTLPQYWVKKAGLSRVRVFFSGENLAELSGLDSHYKADPEGLNGQMYPFQRSYSFGLNVSF